MTEKETEDLKFNTKELEELAEAVKKMHVGITHAVNAFNGNTKLAINQLKESQKLISTMVEELKSPLIQTQKNIDALDLVTGAMAILPDKINDNITELPGALNKSIKENIDFLSRELGKNIDTQFGKGIESFKDHSEEIMRTTNSAMAEAVRKIKSDADQIHYDMKHELCIYTESLDKIIDRSNRFRMRRFFLTTFFCGIFSAIVSVATVWYMIRL